MARSTRVALVVPLVLAFVVWNGVFDLVMEIAERDYLAGQAKHELGRGPAVALDDMLARGRHDGVLFASIWAIAVFAGTSGTMFYVRRLGRREAQS